MNRILFIITLAMTACTQLEPFTPVQQLGSSGAASCLSMNVADADVAVWLTARRCVCETPHPQIYAADFAAWHRAHQVLFLLQTSCFPQKIHRTDIDTLQTISRDKTWNVWQEQLIVLVLDQLIMIEKLQTETRTLTQKLNSTIQGIHSIESELNNLDKSGPAR